MALKSCIWAAIARSVIRRFTIRLISRKVADDRIDHYRIGGIGILDQQAEMVIIVSHESRHQLPSGGIEGFQVAVPQHALTPFLAES
jgi:hypothetical protein